MNRPPVPFFAFGVLCVLLCLAAAACGDDGTGGAAGAPAPGSLGDPCSGSGSCESGLVCSHGTLRGICTAGCAGMGTGDPGCKQWDPGAHCIGSVAPECALGCAGDADCPAGTICRETGGTLYCAVP